MKICHFLPLGLFGTLAASERQWLTKACTAGATLWPGLAPGFTGKEALWRACIDADSTDVQINNYMRRLADSYGFCPQARGNQDGNTPCTDDGWVAKCINKKGGDAVDEWAIKTAGDLVAPGLYTDDLALHPDGIPPYRFYPPSDETREWNPIRDPFLDVTRMWEAEPEPQPGAIDELADFHRYAIWSGTCLLKDSLKNRRGETLKSICGWLNLILDHKISVVYIVNERRNPVCLDPFHERASSILSSTLWCGDSDLEIEDDTHQQQSGVEIKTVTFYGHKFKLVHHYQWLSVDQVKEDNSILDPIPKFKKLKKLLQESADANRVLVMSNDGRNQAGLLVAGIVLRWIKKGIGKEGKKTKNKAEDYVNLVHNFRERRANFITTFSSLLAAAGISDLTGKGPTVVAQCEAEIQKHAKVKNEFTNKNPCADGLVSRFSYEKFQNIWGECLSVDAELGKKLARKLDDSYNFCPDVRFNQEEDICTWNKQTATTTCNWKNGKIDQKGVGWPAGLYGEKAKSRSEWPQFQLPGEFWSARKYNFLPIVNVWRKRGSSIYVAECPMVNDGDVEDRKRNICEFLEFIRNERIRLLISLAPDVAQDNAVCPDFIGSETGSPTSICGKTFSIKPMRTDQPWTKRSVNFNRYRFTQLWFPTWPFSSDEKSKSATVPPLRTIAKFINQAGIAAKQVLIHCTNGRGPSGVIALGLQKQMELEMARLEKENAQGNATRVTTESDGDDNDGDAGDDNDGERDNGGLKEITAETLVEDLERMRLMSPNMIEKITELGLLGGILGLSRNGESCDKALENEAPRKKRASAGSKWYIILAGVVLAIVGCCCCCFYGRGGVPRRKKGKKKKKKSETPPEESRSNAKNMKTFLSGKVETARSFFNLSKKLPDEDLYLMTDLGQAALAAQVNTVPSLRSSRKNDDKEGGIQMTGQGQIAAANRPGSATSESLNSLERMGEDGPIKETNAEQVPAAIQHSGDKSEEPETGESDQDKSNLKI